MRISKAAKLLQKEMEEGIQRVLSGEIKRYKGGPFPTEWVINYMVKHGWIDGEFTTNGWQYDWWQEFSKDEKSYTAFGSGYYGYFEFGATEE